MDSPFGSDEALIGRLPLPLAQLYRRAHNAKTPLERHLTAYYLWEASLKLLASVALVEQAEGGRHDPKLAERLRNLARPSLGHWWEFVRLLVPALADAGDGDFGKVREVLLGRARDDLPRAAGLDALLRESLDGQGGARSTVRLSELFDRLVRYRNRELGHGAAGRHPAEFHERMGRALLAGVAEILDRLDVLAGRRLLFVAEVRRQTSGAWLVERYHLTGEAPRRLESLEVAAAETAALPRPERVYLEAAAAGGPPRLRSLYGLLVYDAEAGEALFLNARRGRRQVEYLSYTTGRTAEQPDAGDQRALLARLVGEAVTAEQTADWVTRSYAEEQQTTAPAEDPGGPGRQVGEFELLSELGRGGMGVVYRAWQPSLGRQVALKCLLKVGDPKAEARFAREIRALGRVEHPNLVKVFTSGSVGEQWFYAMELVDGATLAAVCDAVQARTSSTPGATVVDLPAWHESLGAACAAARQAEKPLGEPAASGGCHPPDSSRHQGGDTPRSPDALAGRSYIRHLVELVRQVAEAAHALHEAGVIHRDIKPGNIMVTADDRHAILMDLGLAQLADEAEGRLTRTRQFVGTLRYASPEQVLAAGRLDRRTDVYSLGATLWELLTLRPLFGATEQTPTPELMQWIQYRDPEPPRKYHPGLPRDLEAVVLKCLEKDPARRYATARELADDLGRFLAGEPVQARRAGRLERAWRWCRRNPVVAGAAALIAVALLAGTGFSSYFAVQANRRADEERQQKERADREAEEARQARDRAETNFRLAVATNASVGDLAERLKPIAGTQTRTVQEILDLAGRNYDRLLAETGETPEVLEGKARMLGSFSEVYLAMNRSRRAVASAREAVGIWQRLLARDPDRLAWYAGLARGRQVLGQALGTQGDTPAALAAFQSSLHLRQRLAAAEPDDPERQADVAHSQHLVAAALYDLGDEAGAEKAYREALRLREDLARRDPADARRQRDLAVTRQAVGDLVWYQGKKADAAALYRQALAQLKAVTRQHPDNAEWQGELAHAYFNVAYVFEDEGNPQETRTCLQESLTILRRLLDADPGNAVWQRQASTARQKLADVLTDPGNLTRERILGVLRERAEGLAQDLALAEARADDDPDNGQLRHGVISAELQSAVTLTALGRLEGSSPESLGQALALARRALEESERLAGRQPENAAWATAPCDAHKRVSNVLRCQGKEAAAVEELLAGLDVKRRACADRLRRAPDNRRAEEDLAFLCLSAGMNRVELIRLGKAGPDTLAKAVQDLEEARARQRAMAEREPGSRLPLQRWQGALTFLALARSLQGDTAAADAARREAEQVKAKLARLSPEAEVPAAPRKETSIFAVADRLSNADLLLGPARGKLNAAEMRYALFPRPERAVEVVAECRDLGRILADVPTRDTYAEARRCLRRALALLQALRRAEKLGKAQEAWLGEVEAALDRLPPDPEAADLGEPVQAAVDELDYRRAAELLLAARRQSDLVCLLVRDFRDGARLPAWRARLVVGIAFEPKTVAEVIRAARAMGKDGSGGLGAEGRRLVALLAWCAGDERAAAEFRAGLPAEAPDTALLEDVDQVLLGAHRFHDRARFLARVIRPLPVKANVERYRYLAQAQLGAAQPEAAAETLGKIHEVEPNNPADRVTLGQVYLQQRRLAEARALFQQLLDTPRLPVGVQTQARYYLAFAYRELGELDKAEAELTRLLDAAPDRASLRARLADFWVDQGKGLEEAEAQVRRQMQEGWEDYPPYLAALGWILCRRGRAEEGLRLLEQAAPAEDVADDPFFWDHLGDAYRLVNADDKARAAWRKALAVFPRTADPGDRRKAAIESKLQAPAH